MKVKKKTKKKKRKRKKDEKKRRKEKKRGVLEMYSVIQGIKIVLIMTIRAIPRSYLFSHLRNKSMRCGINHLKLEFN